MFLKSYVQKFATTFLLTFVFASPFSGSIVFATPAGNVTTAAPSDAKNSSKLKPMVIPVPTPAAKVNDASPSGIASMESAKRNFIRFDHYTNEKGLSNDKVNTIARDQYGVMWIGTNDGLNAFDGYSFTVYKKLFNNENSLSSNFIQDVLFDKDNTMWIATAWGLNKYDPHTKKITRYYHDPNNKNSLISNNLYTLSLDKNGNLWIATQDSGIDLFNPKTGKFTHFVHQPNSNSISSNEMNTVYTDSHNRIWFGGNTGLDMFDSKTGKFTRYTEPRGTNKSVCNAEIIDITEDRFGNIWAASYGKGVFLLNPRTDEFKNFMNDSKNQTSLSSDNAYCLFQMKDGTMVVGTDGGGLNFYNSDTGNFKAYRHVAGEESSLSVDGIMCLADDVNGNLWIGTYQGGLNVMKKSVFLNYVNDPNDKTSLNNNIIHSTKLDASGQLWLATESGGVSRFNMKTETFTSYSKYKDKLMFSVYCIEPDGKDKLWIGTWADGLFLLNPLTGKIEKFVDTEVGITGIEKDIYGNIWIASTEGLQKLDVKNKRLIDYNNKIQGHITQNQQLYQIYPDHHGILWICCDGLGLIRFDPIKMTTKLYVNDPKNPNSLLDNSINSLYEDNKETLWLATASGLCRFDKNREVFHSIKDAKHLLTNTFFGITGIDDRQIWLSCDQGLVRFDPRTQKTDLFDVSSGLLVNTFLTGNTIYPSLEVNEPIFVFSGNTGITLFNPAEIELSKRPPKVMVMLMLPTDMAITSDQKADLFHNEIVNNRSLSLSYKQNSLLFQLTAIDFKNSAKNQYAYMLEGYDDHWVYSGTRRFVNYSKLPGGDYVFKVKVTNSDGVWNEDGASIPIHISTDPLKTKVAYAAYLLLLIVILGLIARFFLNIQIKKHKQELKNERMVADQLKAIDKLRDEFLTSTSYELHTPIHEIIGIADSLTDGAGGELTEFVVDNLNMISNSGKRLSKLINDIQDFSMLKNNAILLNKKPVDMRQTTEVVISILKPLLKNKPVQIFNEIPKDVNMVVGDEGRLEQIMYNLLTNAVKFTEQGSITISANIRSVAPEDSTNERAIEMLEFSIEDTGIGFPQDKLDTVFATSDFLENFDPKTMSDIGLSLTITQNLIQLHGGSIRVRSNVDVGTTISFMLPMYALAKQLADDSPITLPQLQPEQAMDQALGYETNLREDPMPQIISNPDPLLVTDEEILQNSKYRILVVDDDIVTLQMVKNQLTLNGYTLTVVQNGVDALELMELMRSDDGSTPFDLVLLDVMMPKMSGYEVCQRIRETYSSYVLPVLMLTAKNQYSDISECFRLGANDYIAKPFDKAELLARVHTLVTMKESIQEALHNQRKLELSRINKLLMDNIYKLNNVTGSSSVLTHVLDTFINSIQQILSFDNAYIIFCNEQSDFELRAAYGPMSTEIPRQVLSLEKAFSIIELAKQGLPINIPHLDQCEDKNVLQLVFNPINCSWLFVPIRTKDRLQLILILEATTANNFQEDDITTLAAIASQSTIAIENARLFEEVRHLAATDSLTGIHNRRGFYETASDIYDSCIRSKEPVSMLMIDVDHFKNVNDSYGHFVGDEVLKIVVNKLKSCIRSWDLIGRYGGEEFMAIFPFTDHEDAMIIAERYRKSIEEYLIELPGQEKFHVTISIGVSMGSPGVSFAEAIEKADHALYSSKEHGRNRITFQEPLQ